MAELKNTIEENFSRYAGNVILDRAICDVRDMLKPAARMLTYSQLHITKNTADKPFVKSARVVGDCLGHYYTHGDQSCYGTYMRMAKPFAMRYPLEECQGNSGTITATGDEASARYTELRLSKLGNVLFKDIDKSTIEAWNPNFDETDTYPNVLPSKGFYNIVNGTTGIGVAISSSIPQFNLKEVNSALIKLLWDPEAPDNQVIIMPDFATGGTLLNAAEVRESLKNGGGTSCILQSVVEYNAKEHYFRVKELPYGVYTSTITSQIESLLESHPECGVEGVNDGSGKTPDYIIYINKNANPAKVLNLLFKETSLQTFFTINMTVLQDGRTPKVMGLREMFLEHLKHEEIVYRRGYEFDKKKIEGRIHIIDGLLICMANIDEVVHTIKFSNSTAEASVALQSKFLLDEPQTKAVLDMKLSRLAHLEVEKLEKEKRELEKELATIAAILSDEKLLKQEIEKGLREVMNRFGDERRTQIKNYAVTDEENIEINPQKLAIVLSKDQTIRAINLEELKTTGRGTKGTLIDNQLLDYCTAMSTDMLVAIDKEGNSYGIDVGFIPVQDSGIQISSICECGEIVKLAKYQEKSYIIITTRQGNIKKTLLSEYNFAKKQQAIKLKESDSVSSILFANENENILIVNENNKVNNYPIEELKKCSRVTLGTKAANEIKSVTIGKPGDLILTYGVEGKGKKTPFEEFPVNSRTSVGSLICKDTIGVHTIHGDNVLICRADGRMVLCKESEISQHSVRSVGAKLLNGVIFQIESI